MRQYFLSIFFSVGDSNPTIIYTPVKGVIATAGEEASEKEFIDDTAASSLIELSRSSRGQTEERSHRRSPTQQVWSLTQFYTFKIKDRCKQVRFQQTHNQGLRKSLLTVSWDLRA